MPERRLALSEQQIKIVSLASKGLTNRQIAGRLDIKESSVDTQFLRMRTKLGTQNRVDTIVAAQERLAERQGQENQRLAELAQNMPFLLLAFDANYAIVATNEAADALFDYPKHKPEEGRQVWKEVTPGAPERRRRSSPGGDYANHQVRMWAADGRECVIAWFSTAGSRPVPGWHFWVVGVDVTESLNEKA